MTDGKVVLDEERGTDFESAAERETAEKEMDVVEIQLDESVVDVEEEIMPLDLDSLPEGMRSLVRGYMDYVKEVVVDRAIPGIDGLKPSQRRILYTMKYIEKMKDLAKCAGVAGAVMKLHPHGDASIYDTMVRMVSGTGTMNTPLIKGKGSFGKVYSKDEKASASRYTECMLEDFAEEYFKGMGGVDFMPSYNNKLDEPVLLPVSFPSILCNPTQGIAIGMATNIPPFNFHEVVKATIEYIKKGKIAKPLAPDYTTKGEYVRNEKELEKLMQTGSAKLKIRGKWHIEKKTIVIDEIPYYTTVEDIKKAAERIEGVEDVKDTCDRKGLRLTVECSTKNHVEPVLHALLRDTPLQMTVTTNTIVIIDGQPKVIGVEEVISEWVKFRKGVIETEFRKEENVLLEQIERYTVLLSVMGDTEKRTRFMELMLHEGKDSAREYLEKEHPEMDEAICEWLMSRTLGSLSGVGDKQKNHLEILKDKLEDVRGHIADIPEYIVEELKAVSKRYKFPRQTTVTDEDIALSDKPRTRKKDPVVDVVVVREGSFMKKLKMAPANLAIEGAIRVKSNGVISLIDDLGRLMRVKVENMEYVTAREKGMYIPNYIGVGESKIISHAVVEKDKKGGYIYKDGYVALIDYNEWVGKKCTKINEVGLAPEHINLLLGEIDMEKRFLFIETALGRIGVIDMERVKSLRRTRKSRGKGLNISKGDSIASWVSLTEEELSECIPGYNTFIGKSRRERMDDAVDWGLIKQKKEV